MHCFTTPLRSLFLLLSMIALLQFPASAMARDDAGKYSIDEAMATDTGQSFTGVTFYFGDQSYAEPNEKFGTFTSKKTTNAFGKSDEEACQWAFLSAVKSFYERALREGGNAVVNLVSITTGQPFSSATEFECRVGNIVAKVYLRGQVVELN